MENIQPKQNYSRTFPIKEDLNPFSLKDREVEVLSSAAVAGGVYSYGQGVGIVSSIAIAVMIVLIPLLYFFFSIYDSMRTHVVEMEDIRGNLAQNRLDALRNALPEINWKATNGGRTLSNDALGDKDKATLENFKFTNEQINDGKKLAGAYITLGRWKEVLCFKDVELDKIAPKLSNDIHEGIREVRKMSNDPKVQSRIAFLSLALMDREGGKEIKSYVANREKFLDIDEEVLEDLAKEGFELKRLDLFLLRKGIFGKDPKSETFQAGMELIAYKVSQKKEKQFFAHLKSITNAIKNAPKENLEEYLQKNVRERLDKMLQTTFYKQLMNYEGRDNLLVRFVQDLTVAMRLESGGIEHFQGLGERYLKKVKEERGELSVAGSFSYLADALDDVIGKHHWSFKIESLFDKLLVYARYPDKTRMAALSHYPETALVYNSYEVGNFDMAVGDYQLNGHKMRAIHGPTPTGDQLLKGELDALKERKGIHLQHNLEHPGFSQGDLTRIEYLLEVEKEYPKTFRLFSTPLDGAAWKLKGETGKYFKEYSTVKDFFLKYGHFAFTNTLENSPSSFRELQGDSHRKMEGKTDNGFYLGKEVLTDDQFKQAFQYASQAFNHFDPEQEDKERLTRALEVGVQGFIAVGATIKTLQDTYSTPEEIQEEIFRASFGQACKLDIDRGVVLNVMTRALFVLASGQTLDEKLVTEIIGTVVGRAELVSGRTIIADRYQPLSDALRLIGKNEVQVQGALQAYIENAFGIQSDQLGFQSLS